MSLIEGNIQSAWRIQHKLDKYMDHLAGRAPSDLLCYSPDASRALWTLIQMVGTGSWPQLLWGAAGGIPPMRSNRPSPDWVIPWPGGFFLDCAVLVVFQFPVSDARLFRTDDFRRLDVPDWGNLTTEIRPDFIHFFGRALERRRGADNAFTDEITFCQARRALRFDDLAKRRLGPAAALFRPAAAFRRLFSDGGAVTRLEVAISHNVRNRKMPALGVLDSHAVLQIASDACALPTWVPGLAPPERRPLLRQGKALAELYARATSRQAVATATPSPAGELLVGAGEPMLLAELPQGAAVTLPEGWKRVDPAKTHGAALSFGRLQSPVGVVHTWIIQPGTAQPGPLRSLRLCLMRLHADMACLDVILRYARARRIPTDSDIVAIRALNEYFNKATRLINRSLWAGVSQSAILAAYDAAEQVTLPAYRSNLQERFTGVRSELLKKIDDYEIRRAAVRVVQVTTVNAGGTYVEKSVVTNVSGDNNIVNVAEFMNNVTNSVTQNLAGSTAPQELQDLLKQLVQQIEAVSTKIDPIKTQQLGSDAEALSKEVASIAPRRRWFDVSLEGLKEAAEAVGEVGAPILETVKKLTPLVLALIP